MKTSLCKFCKKIFKLIHYRPRKYCSRKCFGNAYKGHKAWNKNIRGWRKKTHTKKLIRSIKKSNSGSRNHNYGNTTWYINPKTGLSYNARKSTISSQGYRLLIRKNHPSCTTRGLVREHRHIMEKSLKRLLKPFEVVHHINGDKLDNRIENLQVMSRKEHMKLHHGNKPSSS